MNPPLTRVHTITLTCNGSQHTISLWKRQLSPSLSPRYRLRFHHHSQKSLRLIRLLNSPVACAEIFTCTEGTFDAGFTLIDTIKQIARITFQTNEASKAISELVKILTRERIARVFSAPVGSHLKIRT